MKTCSILVAAVLLAPVPGAAQPMADRIPADALIYVGFTGARSMGPRYETSHLKAVLDASNFGDVFDELLPALVDRLAEAEPESEVHLRFLVDFAAAIWRHPTAFYFGGIRMEDGNPTPLVSLVIQAADEAEALKGSLDEAVAAMPVMPIDVQQKGNHVVISFGKLSTELDGLIQGSLTESASLAGSVDFQRASSHLSDDAVVAFYVNGSRTVQMVEDLIRTHGSEEDVSMWSSVREALGLSSLKQFIWTGGFKRQQWVSSAFVEAPAPRHGLAVLFDAEPLSDRALRSVPKTAHWASVFCLDLARLVGEIRTGLGRFDPGAVEQFDLAKQQISAMLGLGPEEDLFAVLGREWSIYADAQVGGTNQFGLVVVNHLRDASKVAPALQALANLANGMLMGRNRGDGSTIRIKQATFDGMSIAYLAVPLVTPAWTIRDNRLFIALYPQIVAAAATRESAEDGTGLADNPAFAGLRAQLGAKQPGAVQYVNLPETAPAAYPALLMLERLALGFADMFGIDAPAMVFPTLPQIQKVLSPAASFAWSDERGWYFRSTSPFPGSVLLSWMPVP